MCAGIVTSVDRLLLTTILIYQMKLSLSRNRILQAFQPFNSNVCVEKRHCIHEQYSS